MGGRFLRFRVKEERQKRRVRCTHGTIQLVGQNCPPQAKTWETYAVSGPSLITWALVCAGGVAALLLGPRVQSAGAAIALAIVLAMALAVAVSFGIAACVTVRLCAPVGEEGLSYSLYSLGATPAFWRLMTIRMRMKQS